MSRLFLTRWRAAPERLRTMVMTIVYSLAGAAVSVLFLKLTQFFYARGLPVMARKGLWTFAWQSFLLLTGSSLVVGVLLRTLCPEAAGSGIPQLKIAYWKNLGVLSFRPAWVKLIAGVISLSGGSSLGREGPTVFASASAASVLAGTMGEIRPRRRGAAAAGAAAGLAAAFNTPLAGITFVLEEIVGDLNSRHLGACIVAAVTGAFAVYACVGRQPSFTLPDVNAADWPVLALSPLVAIAAAAVGVFFQKATLRLRGKVRHESRLPLWLRPVIGGLITWVLGVAAFITIGRLGVFSLGYEDLSDAMLHGITWQMAAVLLIAKLGATIASYAWGGCGGIFAPTLFFGAMAGFLMGGLVNVIAGWMGLTGAFLGSDDLILLASVGMSACFGATVRAPLTALLMIFEMTNRFAVVPALMIGTVASQACAHLLGGKWSFYEEILLQDGYDPQEINPPRDLQSWQQQPVSKVLNMSPVVVTDRSPRVLREFMVEHRFKTFPVIVEGRYGGVIRRPAMLAALHQNRKPALEAASVCRETETIQIVADRMVRESSDVAVFVDEVTGEVRGIVTLHDLFRAQSRAIA